MNESPFKSRRGFIRSLAVVGIVGIAIVCVVSMRNIKGLSTSDSSLKFDPRFPLETSGFPLIVQNVKPWDPLAPLAEIGDAWRDVGKRAIQKIDEELAAPDLPLNKVCGQLFLKSILLNANAEPKKAYEVLEKVRELIKHSPEGDREARYTAIYLQGLAGLRRGENENCIMCRGESSCIMPISKSAIHVNPEGSRLAITHFTEYLERFPDDLEVRWLLNVAHMTLGEWPQKVDPRYRLPLDEFFRTNEYDIGRFRDIGHIVGVNLFNKNGGAIMDDFNNDGLLDVVLTATDPLQQMHLLRNNGAGTFDDVTSEVGLIGQFGGINCRQADYNNDGLLDILVVRGAWIQKPMHPSLLRQNEDGTFTDVTEEAGLLKPANTITAAWADYDNDGWLDLFVCCEQQPSRLYHNLRNGKFEEVTAQAGIFSSTKGTKGAAWVDYDNDDYPDLFLTYLLPGFSAALFHNNGNGTFDEVTYAQGIDGPVMGFSCWAWDYDNDGWQDIFATSYDQTLEGVVQGLVGQPHSLSSNRLYHNRQGKGFEDVTKEAGLDMVFATMGSNFGDFDNDGFLDFYLGTGAPDFASLEPNRMFRNIAGKRFVDISSGSGTGHLQKGHGTACGDWDRDGNIDLLVQTGGIVLGDQYHNLLFQNPGHDHHWLTIKLVGKKTNRAAIGARIKIVTDEKNPREIHRHISCGSSFGANPLQQTIGLGDADRIAVLEIDWPTSGTTQVFRNVATRQAIEITEFESDFRKLDWTPILHSAGTPKSEKMASVPKQ